jgi:hypothetical protein
MNRTFLALACALAAAGCASKSKFERYESPGARSMGSDAASRMGSDDPSVRSAIRSGGPFWSERGYMGADTPTADSDRRICDEFRRRVSSGSFTDVAKNNVRCSCENGRLVISGVTQDMDEYEVIYHIGREIAGAGNVVNQLDEPLVF